MALKYYVQQADSRYWSEHWGRYDIASLLQWADSLPLTHLLARYLPPKGKILEAGCGLGQFVLYFQSEGFEIEGIDYSEAAIKACKEFDPSAPVRMGNVRNVDVPDGTYQAYISLGVVEHFEEGPDDILQEAGRVLSPDGLLILSVPFINGVRFLSKPIIQLLEEWKRRNQRFAFYQYAYSRFEITDFLRRNGFEPFAFHPYDSGRLIKRIFKIRPRVFQKQKLSMLSQPSEPKNLITPESPLRLRSSLRSILYSAPVLYAFAHMMLVAAKVRKDS